MATGPHPTWTRTQYGHELGLGLGLRARSRFVELESDRTECIERDVRIDFVRVALRWLSNRGGVTRSNVGEGGVITAVDSSEDFSDDQLSRVVGCAKDFTPRVDATTDGNARNERNRLVSFGGGVG